MPDRQDSDTLTGEPTVPYTPVFDTGGFAAQHDPVKPLPSASAEDAPSESIAASVVPGSYLHLKRWTFVLVVAGVWIVAAAIGVGLYYWWYHSMDKTPPVFAVLLYLVVCTVGSLLVAMVPNKPLVSAIAVAMMSAPLASTAAAAALYGAYVFHWIER